MDLEVRMGTHQGQKEGQGGRFWQSKQPLENTGARGAQGMPRGQNVAWWGQCLSLPSLSAHVAGHALVVGLGLNSGNPGGMG